MLGRGQRLKTIVLVVFFLWFQEFLNDRFLDHFEKCELFSDFLYGFRTSLSTADFLAVVPNGTGMDFNSFPHK